MDRPPQALFLRNTTERRNLPSVFSVLLLLALSCDLPIDNAPTISPEEAALNEKRAANEADVARQESAPPSADIPSLRTFLKANSDLYVDIQLNHKLEGRTLTPAGEELKKRCMAARMDHLRRTAEATSHASFGLYVLKNLLPGFGSYSHTSPELLALARKHAANNSKALQDFVAQQSDYRFTGSEMTGCLASSTPFAESELANSGAGYYFVGRGALYIRCFVGFEPAGLQDKHQAAKFYLFVRHSLHDSEAVTSFLLGTPYDYVPGQRWIDAQIDWPQPTVASGRDYAQIMIELMYTYQAPPVYNRFTNSFEIDTKTESLANVLAFWEEESSAPGGLQLTAPAGEPILSYRGLPQ